MMESRAAPFSPPPHVSSPPKCELASSAHSRAAATMVRSPRESSWNGRLPAARARLSPPNLASSPKPPPPSPAAAAAVAGRALAAGASLGHTGR